MGAGELIFGDKINIGSMCSLLFLCIGGWTDTDESDLELSRCATTIATDSPDSTGLHWYQWFKIFWTLNYLDWFIDYMNQIPKSVTKRVLLFNDDLVIKTI